MSLVQELLEKKQLNLDANILKYIKTKSRRIRTAFFSEIRRGAKPEEALRLIRARR